MKAVYLLVVFTCLSYAQDVIKTVQERAQRGTLSDQRQLVRGDTGKWNDSAMLLHTTKPQGMPLDDWMDEAGEKASSVTAADENWLLFRTRQLDDNDRVWVQKIERIGNAFTITLHEAVWQGSYFKTFTYYEVTAVNLGKLPPGDYTVKWVVKPLIFKQLEKPREAQNNYQTNWPVDEVPGTAASVELKTSFAVSEASSTAQGQRVFSAGHSFHMFMPKMLAELARAAGIPDHKTAGLSSIGGSYVHQHWNVPDEKNTLKAALCAGQVDVLTLSPIYLPDDGIENFARLALEHRPEIRVTVQEFWLPFDVFDVNYKKKKPDPVDRNARTVAELRSINEPYFGSMDAHVRMLNEKLGRHVLYVVPVGQASLALREKIIAGEAPGLKQQNDLFTDAIGHATPPLQWLTAYCHFAVIYRRSPEGLPCPPALSRMENGEALNHLLQRLSWEAVKTHPLSGLQ